MAKPKYPKTSPQTFPQDESYHTMTDTNGKDSLTDTTGRSSTLTSRSVSTKLPDRTESGLDALTGDPQRLIHAIQSLRHLGIETLGVSLPKITVVGDQSTGKSSLIEGMSEVQVPRKDGLCTRCPIEILLMGSHNPDSPWRSRIYLFKKYAYLRGGSTGLSPAKASHERPLGPWQEQEHEDELFATVATKDEVGQALYWAQLAILNPGSNPALYKPGANLTTSQDTEVKFSPNCVRIEIPSPGLPLNFIDLPGIINNPIIDQPDTIELVRNLVIDYIKDDNCICLLAMPMSHDAANCNAARIIEGVGARERTISVLTKPDCVQPGSSLTQWTKLIKDESFYVVKNNPDVNVGPALARLEESAYFSSEEPYASELTQYRDRFGIPNLQSALSAKLTKQILNSLPRIIGQVAEKTMAVNQELGGLPKPPAGNLVVVIHELITAFCQDLRLHIEGGRPEYPFQKQWRDLAIEFRLELGDSRPRLKLASEAPNMARLSSSVDAFIDRCDPPVISLDSDDDDMAVSIETPCTPTASAIKRRQNSSLIHPGSAKKPKKLVEAPRYAIKDSAKVFTLLEIRAMIERAYVGLQGQVDPRVSESMSTDSMQHWYQFAKRFLDKTRLLTEGLVAERLEEIFTPFKQTPLYSKIFEVCDTYLKEAMRTQEMSVQRSINVELYKAMTLNDELMQDHKTKALAGLQASSRNQRATLIVNEQDVRSKKPASSVNRRERIAKAETQLGPDPYEQELMVMATARAYYECAYSRLVDTLSHDLQYDIFRNLKSRETFQGLVIEELGVAGADASERCAILLAVDPKVEERRQTLLKEGGALRKAHIWLESLTKDTGDHDGDSNMDCH